MQKQKADKKIIISICAAVVVIAAAVIILLVNKEEAFRSILVYELKGIAVIERESVGSMNATENLYLESGDRVSIAKDSSMRLKLDDDKYVMAEADTIFSIEAEGTDVNSKTRICLEQGAITNEIQNPLSPKSQYETSTPNAVMAVRGTIYRAELFIDENGDQNTRMYCFQGKVEVIPILGDGTYGQKVLVPAGSELIIYSDGTVDEPGDIAYEELSVQALWTLKGLLESGQSMEGVTLEYLDELIKKETGVKEESEESAQKILSDTDEDLGQTEADSDTDEADVAKKAYDQAGKSMNNSGTKQTKGNPSEEKKETSDEIQPKASEPADSADSDLIEGGSYQEGNTDDTDNDDEQDYDKSDNDKPGDNKSDDDDPVTLPETVTYKVIFEYDGKTFATQEVKSGETASEPSLTPTASGTWNFDFGTGIKADTTIKWT